MKTIIEQALANSYTYADYRSLVAELVDQGKTTGPNQSEFYVGITMLNKSRMDRLDKKARFATDTETVLDNLSDRYTFLVITEAWCGDAAQTVPLINHLAEATPMIDLRLVLRDDNLALMDQYLTNGGRSIPKVIILDQDTLEPLGTWGPRPMPAQQMVLDYKNLPEPKQDSQDFTVSVHKWYAKDKTQTSQKELADLLQRIENTRRAVKGALTEKG